MGKKAMGLSALLVLVGMVVWGCGLLQQSSGGGTSYFPNTQGYTWRYAGTDGSNTIVTVEGTATIGSSTSVQRFSQLYTSSRGTTSTSEAYYRVDSTGVYSHGSPSYPVSTGISIFVFPLEVGKTWDISVAGTYATKATVISKENLTVSAGTFDCYKIRATTTNGTVEVVSSDIWLGNNAGIVKATSSSSTIESVLEWKSF